jgi:hypothetical protein
MSMFRNDPCMTGDGQNYYSAGHCAERFALSRDPPTLPTLPLLADTSNPTGDSFLGGTARSTLWGVPGFWLYLAGRKSGIKMLVAGELT